MEPVSEKLLPEQRQKYVLEHIPYRIAAVNRFLDILIWPPDLTQKTTIPGQQSLTIPVYAITNAFIEHGLVSCRSLLNVLGIRATGKKSPTPELHFSSTGNEPDDITISDLGCELIGERDVRELFPYDFENVCKACLDIIRVTDKAVAHFTMATLPEMWQKTFLICVVMILKLFRDQVNPCLAQLGTLDGAKISEEHFYHLPRLEEWILQSRVSV
ncbi:MAG: hypothetical protein HZB26_06610 [Candidatus Hydrogenedentes bacterium]|nr:hypothetical protein [Candidatus Hydrogenedentota bacterium]